MVSKGVSGLWVAFIPTRNPNSTVNIISTLLQYQGKLKEAEPFVRRAREGCERALGRDHPSTLVSVNNLSGLLYGQGKLSLAEPIMRRALEGRERTLGRDHPDTLDSADCLRVLLNALEKEK